MLSCLHKSTPSTQVQLLPSLFHCADLHSYCSHYLNSTCLCKLCKVNSLFSFHTEYYYWTVANIFLQFSSHFKFFHNTLQYTLTFCHQHLSGAKSPATKGCFHFQLHIQITYSRVSFFSYNHHSYE